MATLPLVTITKKTLILGAGGGYDVYACMPWFLTLSQAEQDKCVLANYTFTDDVYRYDPSDEYVVPISSETKLTKKNDSYFSEYFLATFLLTCIIVIVLLFRIESFSNDSTELRNRWCYL